MRSTQMQKVEHIDSFLAKPQETQDELAGMGSTL